jgi:hypothetical protein
MPTAGEAAGNQSGMQATLDSGIEQLSQQENVTFTRYTKFVLAPDGYVFWIASAQTLTVSGALHYATDRIQEEDQTIATNHVLLTSEQEVTQFNTVLPTEMWIGAWPIGDGLSLQVVFGQRSNYFQQADLFHYSGFAVYPALSTQIVSSAADIPTGPIVSNSLPIWLAQNSFAPVYPSFLVNDNLVPPYISAHVASTQAVGAFPLIGPWPGETVPDSGASPLHSLSLSQLMRDEVTLTLYGFTNQRALRYFQSLIEGSINGTAPFGFANSPAIQDPKRTQVELAALAQKKTIEISANYFLSASDVVARRLILSAMVNVRVIGGVAAYGQAATYQTPQVVTAVGTVGE